MAARGGVVSYGLWKYAVFMLIVGLLFGVELMKDLNHAVVNVASHFIGSVVGEVPSGADTVQDVRSAIGQG